MNARKGFVYDFELMEEANSYIVVSMVIPGLPSLASSAGENFSMVHLLPVTPKNTSSSAEGNRRATLELE